MAWCFPALSREFINFSALVFVRYFPVVDGIASCRWFEINTGLLMDAASGININTSSGKESVCFGQRLSVGSWVTVLKFMAKLWKYPYLMKR